MADEGPLLEVEGLEKHYPVTEGLLDRRVGTVRAVDGVSFTLGRGETLGLVGESGCGKSTLAASLLRLEEPTDGTVRFDGEDVGDFDECELRRFRRDAQLVLQDPNSSFDPRMRVGESVTEPLRIHGMNDRARRREIGEAVIERVGLGPSDYDRFPHEFSGGQRQRLALARALVVNPSLLVADEPVSALDVSVQSQVLSLLADLKAELGLSVLLVSHDLGVVREVCDRIAVMYLGGLVEVGPTERVFAEPRHPYTEALVDAIPEPVPGDGGPEIRLSGSVPDASNPPAGCRFHTRCPAVIQPDGVDVEQPTWRRLLDARDRVADGRVDVEAVRERHDEGNADSGADLRNAVREELDLGEPISDGALEGAVERAVGALVASDRDTAVGALADAVTTPCERHSPTLRPVGDEHEVACHLHSPLDGVVVARRGGRVAGSGFEWTNDGAE